MTRTTKVRFDLQLDPSKIRYWADRYDAAGDEDALGAGKRIADGDFSVENLAIIFKWKTRNRGISRLCRDSVKVGTALRQATQATDERNERSAVEALTRLSGVAVPVASAILTAIYPGHYTVIDFRGLESLGTGTGNRSVPFYLCYLRFCRDAAVKYGVDLRTFDRALWQRSYERSRSGEAL